MQENDFILKAENIHKSFTDGVKVDALKGVSLSVKHHEFICLLGYSGCGKSTLLRVISQLERQDSGRVLLDGKEYNSPSKDIMFLFQDFNQLFPWLTVKKNIMFPLLKTGICSSKREASEKAEGLLRDVGLSDFMESYPHQLSGGMKQRAAVARALLLEPKVLLMDEPFAALDASTRSHLQELTKKICSEHGVTVIFVTHNIEEAVLMGTRIVVMSAKSRNIDRIIDNSLGKNQELVSELIDVFANQLKENDGA